MHGKIVIAAGWSIFTDLDRLGPMVNIHFKKIFITCCLFSMSAFAETHLCFMPGAMGADTFVNEQVIPALKRQNISFLLIPIKKGDVFERSQKLGEYLSEKRKQDPSFKCHMMAHSMGGVIIRYALNHVQLEGGVPVSDVIDSFFSISAPHRGTFLADWVGQMFPDYSADVGDLSEAKAALFNDPVNVATYSPAINGMRTWSVGTFVQNPEDFTQPYLRIGHSALFKYLTRHGRDTRNDGIIPLDSQGFEHVLGYINGPHHIFTGAAVRDSVVQFYSDYWNAIVRAQEADFANHRLEELFRERFFTAE